MREPQTEKYPAVMRRRGDDDCVYTRSRLFAFCSKVCIQDHNELLRPREVGKSPDFLSSSQHFQRFIPCKVEKTHTKTRISMPSALCWSSGEFHVYTGPHILACVVQHNNFVTELSILKK